MNHNIFECGTWPYFSPVQLTCVFDRWLVSDESSPLWLDACSVLFRATTGATTRTWWPSSVLQTTATAVETRQPSWNWTTPSNTLCKYTKLKRNPTQLTWIITSSMCRSISSSSGLQGCRVCSGRVRHKEMILSATIGCD